MQVQNRFEFEKFDTKFGPVERIRIKGSRIAIEHLLALYKQEVPGNLIQQEHYPTLTLEELQATIAYYLQNKVSVDAYLERGEEVSEAYYQDYLGQEPPPVVKRLRELRDQQQANDVACHE